MVNDKLVEEVREKIRLGMNEGAIKSFLLLRGETLDDIEAILSREIKGVKGEERKEKVKKEVNWTKPVAITLIVMGVTMLFAIGGMRVYESFVNNKADGDITQPTPSPTQSSVPAGAVPYRVALPEEILSREAYVNSEERFSIRPPKDWETDTSGKLGAPVFFFSKEATEENGVLYKASINVQTGLAKGHILDGYKQFYVEDLKKKLENLNILEERKLILSGRDAVLLKVTFTSAGLKLKGEILLMVNIDTAFVTTGLDLESHWPKTENAIETSLYTFNLL